MRVGDSQRAGSRIGSRQNRERYGSGIMRGTDPQRLIGAARCNALGKRHGFERSQGDVGSEIRPVCADQAVQQ